MIKKQHRLIISIFIILILSAINTISDGYYVNIDNVDVVNEELSFDVNNIENEILVNNLINIILKYNEGTDYDGDNDGIETSSGIIDFTVKDSVFNEDINKQNLCTRWEIYSEEEKVSNIICYGNEECCNFINLAPTKVRWNDDLYLFMGKHGSTYNNKVSAQIIHLEYNLNNDNPSTNIFYSDWSSLPATFMIDTNNANEDQQESQTNEESNTFFNTLAEDPSENLSITINNPINNSILGSGEQISFNCTSNIPIKLNYSLDNQIKGSFPESTSFQSNLNGTLQYNIINNGQHHLLVNTIQNNTIKTINQTFTINDIIPPKLTLNITNNSFIEQPHLEFSLKIIPDETSKIKYRLNQIEYSEYQEIEKNQELNLQLNPVQGLNNLYIQAEDFQNNNHEYYYSFYFIELGTCDDGKENGDETGIDCGGRCSECIDFNIETDKETYNFEDNKYITVTARANSLVNLTVKKDSTIVWRNIFTPVFTGAPIYETRLINNITSGGNYIITATNYYLQNEQTLIDNFEVLPSTNNPLTVSISSNATTIDEGDYVRFTSSVSGSSGNLIYKWDINNDKTIDYTTSEITHQFGNNKTYRVNLTVFDDKHNKSTTKDITVKKLFNITIIVKDNKTKSNIQNAEVEFDDEQKNTSSDGSAWFTSSEGRYDLVIDKNNYKIISENIDVERPETFYFNLTEDDDSSPVIQLLNPANNTKTSGKDVGFKFRANDLNSMSCSLFLKNNYSSFWEIVKRQDSVSPNTDTTLTYTISNNGTYLWKIECVDNQGNSNFSSSYTLQVSQDPEELATIEEKTETESDETAILTNEINNILDNLGSLSATEREAADAMGLRKILERSIKELERANRDVHSLKWRRLNDTEFEIERQKILDRIDEVSRTTPKSIAVIDTNEFVSYPKEEDVEFLLRKILNKTNKIFKKKEVKNLVEENLEHQDNLKITTNAKIIDVQYISGNRGAISLIQKTITKNNDFEGLTFFEIIPKSIANRINETIASFEYEIFEDDPIIRIDIDKFQTYSYYVNKKIDLNDAENIVSILIDESLNIKKKSGITGLSVLSDFTSSILDGSDFRLVIEVAIIIILAVIYLLYSFGYTDKIKQLFKPKEAKKITELVDDTKKSINEKEYEKASTKYKILKERFDKLEEKHRPILKKSIIDLANQLNMLFIEKLVSKAEVAIDENKKKNAMNNYKKIQSLYKIVPKNYKKEVREKCMEIYQKLSAV